MRVKEDGIMETDLKRINWVEKQLKGEETRKKKSLKKRKEKKNRKNSHMNKL